MIVRLKHKLLVITAEDEQEREQLEDWASDMDGNVLHINQQDAQTIRLANLGARSEACREPINVTSMSTDPNVQLISNLAHTPFVLAGKTYASVEGFWQGLKFPDKFERRQLASMHGRHAKAAGSRAPKHTVFEFEGTSITVGTYEHWQLMQAACKAKFNQHYDARQALLDTADRPLEHRVRRDSKTIPGVIMAEIWMRIRSELWSQNESER